MNLFSTSEVMIHATHDQGLSQSPTHKPNSLHVGTSLHLNNSGPGWFQQILHEAVFIGFTC